MLTDLVLLFSGALLVNSVPHLVKGVQGDGFPTPFASPPGIGDSSPLINVLWGDANLLAGLLLFWRFWPGSEITGWIAFALGGLLMSVICAVLFGRRRGTT